VLQKNRRQAKFPDRRVLFLNSEESIDVAVVALYVMNFNWVVKVLAVLKEWKGGLWVLNGEHAG
jgi:hypothetical protein